MGKVALVDPAGMVTVAETEATAGSLSASVTTVPPAGAGRVIHTVPDAGVPPNVLASGNASSCARVGAGRLLTTSTVIVTLWVSDPLVAVSVSGKLPSGAVLSALSGRGVLVPKIVPPYPSVPRIVLSVMVGEAGGCGVAPPGGPPSRAPAVPPQTPSRVPPPTPTRLLPPPA